MSIRCIAEFETHDPSGRYVKLYVYRDEEGVLFYEPTLSDGEPVRLSYVFRIWDTPPEKLERGEENSKIDEIESKIRFFCSTVKKMF